MMDTMTEPLYPQVPSAPPQQGPPQGPPQHHHTTIVIPAAQPVVAPTAPTPAAPKKKSSCCGGCCFIILLVVVTLFSAGVKSVVKERQRESMQNIMSGRVHGPTVPTVLTVSTRKVWTAQEFKTLTALHRCDNETLWDMRLHADMIAQAAGVPPATLVVLIDNVLASRGQPLPDANQ